MLTGIPPQSILSTLKLFGPPVLSPHSFPKGAFPTLHPFITIPYPASAAQWLIDLLDLFAGIVDRHADLEHIVVTETEYQSLSAVLADFVYGVGEDESHPLSAVMALVGRLIKMYEDQHFPKLTDLYPELAEDTCVETVGERKNVPAPLSDQIDTDFGIVFFSIGCLLWTGGKSEEAIAAYDLASRIDPDSAGVHASRGEAKSGLNDFIGAKADLQNALELSEKQGEVDFGAAISERLQELDTVAAAVAYFSEPRFAQFSILREHRIQIGVVHSRADIVLRDAEGNFIVIVACKLSGVPSYTEPLKSYLCATDAPFGIFAAGTSRESWLFYENLRHNRFQQIERSDFEERVLL